MNLKTILSSSGDFCITFIPQDSEYYFGYRFLEDKPLILDRGLKHPAYTASRWGHIPTGLRDPITWPHSQGWNADWLSVYNTPDSTPGLRLSFQAFADGSAWVQTIETDRQQEFYFQPVADGVQIWLRFTTTKAIRGTYCIQQCLRFTGRLNSEWRQAVAYTPFLSEFDMQAMGRPNGTLTYARHNNQWLNFSVPFTIYPLQTSSLSLPGLSSELIDSGLVVRETPDRKLAPASYFQTVAPEATWDQITAGLYWERTAFISNRHPADCIHAWVDVGPLAAGQVRTLHGKIYYIEGSKSDLLEHWQRDFMGAG